MKTDDVDGVEEIIAEMECHRDFKCCRSGYTELCRVKIIGEKSYLECLEENPEECDYSVSFGYSYFCQCPVRNRIAKKLKR